MKSKTSENSLWQRLKRRIENPVPAWVERQFWWRIVSGTVSRFAEIDGDQRAGAFAYYAIFSLFPLITLFITIASSFVEREQAADLLLDYLNQHLPVTPQNQADIRKLIEGIIQARGQAGLLASFVLLWGAMRFFYVLVRGVNCAWGTKEYTWWQLPLKNLTLLGVVASAVSLGILTPVVTQIVVGWLPFESPAVVYLVDLALLVIPFAILYYGFSLFFKLAPRRTTHWREIWFPALLVTVLLRLSQYLFLWYVSNFGSFNALYGTLAGIMALLLWAYISGYVIILGGCLCAVLNRTPQRGTHKS